MDMSRDLAGKFNQPPLACHLLFYTGLAEHNVMANPDSFLARSHIDSISYPAASSISLLLFLYFLAFIACSSPCLSHP